MRRQARKERCRAGEGEDAKDAVRQVRWVETAMHEIREGGGS